MITFITHDMALMWSRVERLLFTMLALLVIGYMESLGTKPTWLITSISTIIAQLIALKCWADMAIMSEPFKNCWAFKG